MSWKKSILNKLKIVYNLLNLWCIFMLKPHSHSVNLGWSMCVASNPALSTDTPGLREVGGGLNKGETAGSVVVQDNHRRMGGGGVLTSLASFS